MKPVIGITSRFQNDNSRIYSAVSYDYVKAINNLGGMAVILPAVMEEELLNDYIYTLDGLLLSGGEDLLPLLYGEDPIDKVNCFCYDRDKCEISLFKKAYEKKIPILGICRGMQVINVALGGTLYQDINKQIKNSAGHRFQKSIIVQLHHEVKIIEGSKLYNILGKKDITVNSFHHQSIKDIGKGLRATAYSNDGIIEGIESLEQDFLIGVQWHPEELIEKHPIFKSIFKSFIDICRIN